MKQSSPPRRNFHNDFVFCLWKEILSQQRIRHLESIHFAISPTKYASSALIQEKPLIQRDFGF